MNIKTALAGSITALVLTCSLNAQVLMLDFGPTEASGAWVTNSPYHSAGGSNSHDTWNRVQTADIAAGTLKWSDGTIAADITLDVGRGSATALELTGDNLTNPEKTSALGSKFADDGTSVYAGTSAGRDGIFSGNNNTIASVGVQIGGLAAGKYTVFISGRNTSADGHTQNYYLGTEEEAGAFTFSEYAPQQIAYTTGSNATSWVAGGNYVEFSVTLSAGEVLNIAVIGTGTEKRGFLNSVQIVSAVPEPSTYAMFAGLGILGFALVRRKVRANRTA